MCNVKCPSEADAGNTECEISKDDLQGVKDLVGKEAFYPKTEIIHVASGLILISTSGKGHQVLEHNWEAFGCATMKGRLTPDQGLAYAQCAGSINSWLHALRSQGVMKMVSDAKFSTICLHYR